MNFWLFVLLLPTQLTFHFWPDFAFIRGIRVDYLAPAVYLTDLLFLSFIIPWGVKPETRRYLSKHKNSIFLFCVFALANIVVSEIAALTFYRWLRVGEFFLVFLYAKTQKELLWSIKAPVMFSLLFTLCLSVAQIINSGSLGGVFYFFGERHFSQNAPGIALTTISGNEILRPYATFSHPNVLGGFALVSFLLFYSLKWKFLWLLKFVSLFLIIISFSQNAWTALIIAPIFYWFLKENKKRLFWFLVSSVAASFFLTIAKPVDSLPREVLQRIELNTIAGEIFSRFPVLGVGLGVFISKLSIWWLQPVHNIFLLLGSETGLAGLAIFIFFVLKNTNKYNLLPVVAVVLLSMWDHYFVTIVQTNLLFAIVLGYNGETGDKRQQ